MSRIECPECGKGLRVPDSKRGAVVRCPGCKEKFRIPDLEESRTRRPDRSEGPRRRRSGSDDVASAGRRRPKPDAAEKFDTRGFIKRLFPIHAVVLGLAVLLVIGGFFSRYSSLAAAGLLVVAAVGCIIAGRIWMAIDIGRKSVGLGIAALLVPAVGVAISFRDR